ncbi:unnamed protein product, partial [Ascophyllum nodosum]
FTQSNEIYSYPDLWICTQESYGCDEEDYIEQCTKSINDTEGGPTTARYRPGDKDELNIYFTANFTEVTEPTFSQDKLSCTTLSTARGWCVIFGTSAMKYHLGKERNMSDLIDYTSVHMYWYPGGSPNNSTTCIQETGGWTSHTEIVYAYLADSVSGGVSAAIPIPYTCITNESSSNSIAYMRIGATKKYKINGDETISYKAQTVSTVKHKRNESITGMQAPYAYVKLELHQEFDSLVEVTEIDPFDLAEIVGQIGGFWDLLLFSWPIFFVAISYEAPSLKARDFRKSAVRATENVTKVVLPTVLRRFRTGTAKRQSGRMCGGVETFEELPPWE